MLCLLGQLACLFWYITDLVHLFWKLGHIQGLLPVFTDKFLLFTFIELNVIVYPHINQRLQVAYTAAAV